MDAAPHAGMRSRLGAAWLSAPEERSGGVAALPAAVPDETLVARARAGQSDAFGTLVSRYQDRVYTIVYSYVRHPEDALDVAQEAFVKAYLGLDTFRGRSAFYTWLYRIAVNCSKDWLASRQATYARATCSLDDPELDPRREPVAEGPEWDPAAAAERGDLQATVRAAVLRLPENLRVVVTLHDLEGLTQQDVAAVLQCPLGTAKSGLFRARARLRRMLAPHVGDEAARPTTNGW